MKKFCYRVEIYDKDSNMINVYYDYCCAIDIMSSHDIIRIIVKQSYGIINQKFKDYMLVKEIFVPYRKYEVKGCYGKIYI